MAGTRFIVPRQKFPPSPQMASHVDVRAGEVHPNGVAVVDEEFPPTSTSGCAEMASTRSWSIDPGLEKFAKPGVKGNSVTQRGGRIGTRSTQDCRRERHEIHPDGTSDGTYEIALVAGRGQLRSRTR